MFKGMRFHVRGHCHIDSCDVEALLVHIVETMAQILCGISCRGTTQGWRETTTAEENEKSFEDELDMVPLEQGITHLYNTRGIVDKWLGHPTLDSIFPGAPLDVEILHHVEYDGSFPHCCGRT
jgi:hypothetical protein